MKEDAEYQFLAEIQSTGAEVVKIRDKTIECVCDWTSQDIEQLFKSGQLFGLRTALGEALVNAMIHGNMSDEKKKICLEMRGYKADKDKFHLSIRVKDEGKGFDLKDVPDPRMRENRERTSGRGLLLINEYMDDVEYQDDGSKVIMRKSISIAPKAAE